MPTKHTPGPWTVNPTGGKPIIGVDPGDMGPLLPIVDCVSGYDDAQCAANARLIAAAPRMLAALEQIERLGREADGSLVDVRAALSDIARTVIAEATGA